MKIFGLRLPFALCICWSVCSTSCSGSDALAQHSPETAGTASDYEPVHDKPPKSKIAMAASAVGVIAIVVDQEPNPDCTGVMIAPDKILTARHCLYDEGTPPAKLDLTGGVQFWLDYYQFGKPITTLSVDVQHIKMGSGNLDYAVLPLVKSAVVTDRHIPARGSDPQALDDLAVLESRDARPIELVRKNCFMPSETNEPIPDELFAHTCSTQKSSSGSPIFDQDWKLVGIHVRGGKSDLKGTFNLGIKLSKIMEDDKEIRDSLDRYGALTQTSSTSNFDHGKFSLDNGETILQEQDAWSIQRKNGDKVALKLQAMGPEDMNLVFWLVSNDTYLKVASSGGAVMQRKATGGAWTAYASAIAH